MAFKTYQVNALPNGQWQLSHPEPVRFSGPHGLVARFLEKQPLEVQLKWGRSDKEWLEQINMPDTMEHWLVFEQVEDDKLQISRLHRVNGAGHHHQTELLLSLSPLSVEKVAPTLTVSVPQDGRSWSEELALDGQVGRTDSTWRWCERALHVGAATFGTH